MTKPIFEGVRIEEMGLILFDALDGNGVETGRLLNGYV